MGFGLIVIGDELLSGKRQDKHFAHVIQLLGERGLSLDWCRIIGDEARLIVATLRETMAADDVVFCCGGIGATPDDLTRACAAEAAGVTLQRHPEAVKEIEAQYGEAAYPTRIRLAELPAGSTIIPNPINRVPGFSLGRHHFLPGFPEMAWPMMRALLDGEYRSLHRARPPVDFGMTVYAREGQLLSLMEECVRRFPDCRLSSLPTLDPVRPQLELAVRGEEERAAAARAFLQQGLAALGVEWREPGR
jgi:molybdopterin-biosynthesis enzyme MoeA-like protein